MSYNFTPAVRPVAFALVFFLGGLVSTLSAQTPVAHYPFDGDTDDYSGNDLHGTPTGIVFTQDRNGVANSAAEFTDPADSRIALGNHAEFNDLGNEFTITFWTKIDTDAGGNIIDHDIIGTTPDWGIGVLGGWGGATDGMPYFVIGACEPGLNCTEYADMRADGGGYKGNAWYHVAIRRESANGGNLWFFVDGNPAGSYTGYDDDLNVSTDTNLGPTDGDSNGFVGSIDDLRFYNRLLSDEEIIALADGPVAYYPFDGDTDDYSGNDLHGTPTGIVFTEDCNGIANSAAEFTDPADSRIALGNHAEFNDLGNEFTITFWTKIDTDAGGNIIDHDIIGTTPDWGIGVLGGWGGATDGMPYFVIGACEPGLNCTEYADMRADGGGYKGNAWYHVAIRRESANGGNLWFFVDGNPAGSYTGYDDDLNVSTDTNLGPTDGDSNGFVGSIDDLRFYNRLLSDEEVSLLASRCPAGEPIPAVSEWGVVLMALLTLTAGTLVYVRRKPAPV